MAFWQKPSKLWHIIKQFLLKKKHSYIECVSQNFKFIIEKFFPVKTNNLVLVFEGKTLKS